VNPQMNKQPSQMRPLPPNSPESWHWPAISSLKPVASARPRKNAASSAGDGSCGRCHSVV
jgi:hypothetical protein